MNFTINCQNSSIQDKTRYDIELILSFEILKTIDGICDIIFEIANHLSVFLNLVLVIFLFSFKLNHRIYILIELKAMNLIIRSIFEALDFYLYYVSLSEFSLYTAYYAIFFSFIKQSSSALSSYIELALTNDRLCLIENRKNWFSKMSIGKLVIIMLVAASS